MHINIRKIKNILKIQKKILFPLALVIIGLIIQVTLLVSQKGSAAVVFGSQQLYGSTEETVSNITDQVSSVELKSAEVTAAKDIAFFGVTINKESLAGQAEQAKSYQHFIPLWGLKTLLGDKTVDVEFFVDDQRLEAASLDLAEELTTKPVDARMAEQEGRIVVLPEVNGNELAGNDVKKQISNYFSGYREPDLLELQGTQTAPKVVAGQLVPLIELYSAVIAQDLSVLIDETEFTLSSGDLLNLIDIESDVFALDSEELDQVIAQWSSQVSQTAGITQIKYVDDVEISRDSGQAGRTLDVATVVKAIETWFGAPSTDTIILETHVVPPKIVASRTYTKSSLGLQKVLEAWVAENPGTYKIAVRELNGQGREAFVSASTPVVMASTYKVFLAVAAYTLAENSEISLSTVIYNGKNIEECIAAGIIYSDNSCMVALGEHITWAKVDTTLSNMGFPNTRLNNYNGDGSYNGDKTSPASEQAAVLVQLSGGSLINSTHTATLISYMKQQTYRDGIPAGSSGAVVANKVGFLYSYIHDMGIVYGPKSTYALVILTESSSWSKIEDLAQTVYDFMN